MSIKLSAPAGYTSSELVFNDNFSGTKLSSSWNTFITSNAAQGWAWNDNGSGGSAPGGAYDADYDMPSQISVNNGLTLTATRHDVMGVNQGASQKYPITSGAVSSYGKFEFTGGYLQISMAAPTGDGAWPSLWLLPGKGAGRSGDNYEIDMEEGGYTPASTANENMSYHLHTPSGTFGRLANTGTNLTAGYNTYGIDWEPGKSITWYLNGKEVGQLTSAQAPIPKEPMEVIMNNQVANSNAAGWHTVLDGSTPQSMPMKIADVQLYQKPGSGDSVLGKNVTQTSSVTASTTMSKVSTPQSNGSAAPAGVASSGTNSVAPSTGPSSSDPSTSQGSSPISQPNPALGRTHHHGEGNWGHRSDLSQLSGLIKQPATLAPQPGANAPTPESWSGVGASASTLLNQLMASAPAERLHMDSFLKTAAADQHQQVAALTKPLH